MGVRHLRAAAACAGPASIDSGSRWSWVAALRRPCSWTLQKPQTERREHQDNSDVYDQPLPEVVPEEQDVHADHDGYQREHVEHDGCLSSHRFVLLGATEWSKNGRLRWRCVRDDDLPILAKWEMDPGPI